MHQLSFNCIFYDVIVLLIQKLMLKILVLNVLMMPLVKMVNAHAKTDSREMAKLVKVVKIYLFRLDYIIYQNECKV